MPAISSLSSQILLNTVWQVKQDSYLSIQISCQVKTCCCLHRCTSVSARCQEVCECVGGGSTENPQKRIPPSPRFIQTSFSVAEVVFPEGCWKTPVSPAHSHSWVSVLTPGSRRAQHFDKVLSGSSICLEILVLFIPELFEQGICAHTYAHTHVHVHTHIHISLPVRYKLLCA